MLHFQILSIADEGVCGNQATIASRLGIDRTVMTYRVDDLEKDGLVTRRPDPADRRARQVVLCATWPRRGQAFRAVPLHLSFWECLCFRIRSKRVAGPLISGRVTFG